MKASQESNLQVQTRVEELQGESGAFGRRGKNARKTEKGKDQLQELEIKVIPQCRTYT